MDYEARFERIEGILSSIAPIMLKIVEVQASLVEIDRRIGEKLDAAAVEIKQLIDAQRHTDERLNGLIGYIDRMDRRPSQ